MALLGTHKISVMWTTIPTLFWDIHSPPKRGNSGLLVHVRIHLYVCLKVSSNTIYQDKAADGLSQGLLSPPDRVSLGPVNQP